MKQIFSQKCAGFLMLHGFRLVRLEVNLKNPRKHVFIFHESPELLKTLEIYSKTHQITFS